MKTVFLLGVIVWAFNAGISFGLTKQARALEGCEVVAAQAERDAEEAEGKSATCDSIFKNLGALEVEEP